MITETNQIQDSARQETIRRQTEQSRQLRTTLLSLNLAPELEPVDEKFKFNDAHTAGQALINLKNTLFMNGYRVTDESIKDNSVVCTLQQQTGPVPVTDAAEVSEVVITHNLKNNGVEIRQTPAAVRSA